MAEIICHRTADEYGQVTQYYEWIGPVTEPVELGLEFRGFLGDLPWRLIEIENRNQWNFLKPTRLFIREDAGFWVGYHWLVSRWMVHSAAIVVFQQRLILTFNLWGIGHTSPYEIPRWQNLARKNPYG